MSCQQTTFVEPGQKLIAALITALEPFAECAALFGESWDDYDEIAFTLYNNIDDTAKGSVLTTIKVGQFREAAAAIGAIDTAIDDQTLA